MANIDRKLEFKLLIERRSKKVLFAEVGKDVVDFLFSLFALPLGSVINLITKESTIGSLGIMYSSWEQLDNIFLPSTRLKANLLIPAISSAVPSSNFARVLSSVSPATSTEQIYICKNNNPGCSSYFTDVHGTTCKSCFHQMTLQPKYAGRNVTKEEVKRDGYVKGGLTYAVLDDLSIVPLTASLASISLLDKLGHRDLSLLEQKTVLYVQAEGLELLKTSLWSKNVLTDVFLAKKKDDLKKEVK